MKENRKTTVAIYIVLFSLTNINRLMIKINSKMIVNIMLQTNRTIASCQMQIQFMLTVLVDHREVLTL